jgi:CHAD domain-containing protein
MSTRELVGEQEPSIEQLELALRGEFVVQRAGSSTSDRVYRDTFDALLRSRGLLLVQADGMLSLLDRRTGGELQAQRCASAPGEPLLGDELPPGPLLDALIEVIEVRALLPLVRVLERTDAIRVLDSLQKTVVRVGVITPELVSSGGVRTALRTRVRLDSLRGYERELARLEALLAESMTLAPAELPLLDEALRVAGEPLEGISTKIEVRLRAHEHADRATVRVLWALLAVMDANLPGALADTDSEFLHDFRVAVRRTRAVQRELAGVFEPIKLGAIRAEFRWLQLATGDARDLDVYVVGFESLHALLPESLRDDLEPLRAVLRGRRLTARREMGHALRSDRARRLRDAWEDVLGGLEQLPTADRPDATRPIGEVSSRQIRKVYRRMLRMGAAIDQTSPPQDYHELRKKGKELRYLLELFGAPLNDEGVVRPMIRALKSLQDVLGRHQDREVQVSKLRSLADEVSAMSGGSEALMAMGVLIERLQQDAAVARAEFAESFATFSSKAQRRLVKETFR